MKNLVWLSFLISGFLLPQSSALGAVSGPRVEVFGADRSPMDFTAWVVRPDALLTPEVAHLATQACLRKSQQSIDARAYQLTHAIARDLSTAFPARPGGDTFSTGLSRLADLLQTIDRLADDPAAQIPETYITQCRIKVQEHFTSERDALKILYQGRMQPKPNPALAKRGLEVVPLTWETLTDQICQLEGYYSDPTRPQLWRFFSMSRALQNVLPSDANDAAFRKAVSSAPAVVSSIATLNRYSSIAGKANGAAIGMSEEETIKVPARLTGPAAGSRATSLVATFTTGWRERLQWLTMTRPYPQKPFALLSSNEILQSLVATRNDALTPTADSATETGMLLVWNNLLPGSGRSIGIPDATRLNDYGPVTADYRRASALAWLALNAETNLRANEKLPGVRYSSGEPQSTTTLVYGAPGEFELIAKELDSAKSHFAAVEANPARLPSCLNELDAFVRSAQSIPARTVGTVEAKLTGQLRSLQFEPVYADIGLEVEDEQAGSFRLGLATGYGHLTSIAWRGQSYQLWSPSAIVIHRPTVVSTRDWKNELVRNYDRAE